MCSHRICYGRAVASLMKIRSWARPLVCSQRISNGHAVVSLIIIRSLQFGHTRWCVSQRICNGHAVVSLMIIRSLQWAHTLVCFPSHWQRPCRCFPDYNSEITVGTHVGVFPAHLQRQCRCLSDNNSKLGTHVGVPSAFATAMPLLLRY